jgi:uncharacterized repeat protein (TIGR02543 family)
MKFLGTNRSSRIALAAFWTLILVLAFLVGTPQKAHAATYNYDIDCSYAYGANINTNIFVTLQPGDIVNFTNITTLGNGYCGNRYTVETLTDYFTTDPTIGVTQQFVVKANPSAANNARIAFFTVNIGGGATNGRQFYFTIAATSQTVTFNANGGSGSMSNQTASSATALTSNSFNRNGYTFSGWNTAADGSGTPYSNGASYSFSSSTTLYAQWTVNTYTVTFNANTGSGSMPNQTASTTTTLSTNTITKNGYTFTGWNTAANGSGTPYGNGAQYPFTSSTTLYAQWAINTYTVTFDANGGTGSMPNQTATIATNLTVNSLIQSGYTFSGWNTVANGSGTPYSDAASYPFTSSATLYAQWTAVSSPNAQNQPAPNQSAPEPPKVIKSIEPIGKIQPGSTLSIKGDPLPNISEILIGGIAAKIVSRSSGEIVIEIPEGLSGAQPLVISSADGSYNYSGQLKFANAPRVVDIKRLSRVSGFLAGSFKLHAQMMDSLEQLAKSLNPGTRIVCTGYSAGPTILPGDYKLALSRAKTACGFLRSIQSELQISLKAVTSKVVGSTSRKVEISISR